MIDPPSSPAPPATPPPAQPPASLLWPHAVQLVLAALFGVLLTHLLYQSLGKTTPAARPDALALAPTRIELNSASSDDLLLLPGIGPSLAERIIEHRRQHGTFRHVDELRAVPGIGPATLQRLRPLVYVEKSEAASLVARSASMAVRPKGKKEAALSPQAIDLNRASADELQKLPGIGPKLAQRIIDHRLAKGPFASVEDVRKVSGIGPKILDRIKPYVSLGRNVDALARK
jgi:competence protein ComEA